MLLTLDVGNTNMTGGVFQKENIVATFRITTKMPRTSDEYGILLCNLLQQNKIDVEEITKFATSIWQEDNGDGKISDDEIESYIQKNQSEFKNTEIK